MKSKKGFSVYIINSDSQAVYSNRTMDFPPMNLPEIGLLLAELEFIMVVVGYRLSRVVKLQTNNF